eukprot:3803368-Rhodomonas_salina.1
MGEKGVEEREVSAHVRVNTHARVQPTHTPVCSHTRPCAANTHARVQPCHQSTPKATQPYPPTAHPTHTLAHTVSLQDTHTRLLALSEQYLGTGGVRGPKQSWHFGASARCRPSKVTRRSREAKEHVREVEGGRGEGRRKREEEGRDRRRGREERGERTEEHAEDRP